MERNVHVSKSEEHARREIPFIFPNYIYEPIPTFELNKFCQSPLIKDLINEAYALLKNATEHPDQWKIKMAEWLTLSNKTLPRISNQCSHKPLISRDDKTTYATSKPKDPCQEEREVIPITRSATCSTGSGASAILTTSSCMTCSCFDGEATCLKKPEKIDSGILLFKAKTENMSKTTFTVVKESEEEYEHECEGDIEWVEVFEEADQGDNEEVVQIGSGEIVQEADAQEQEEQQKQEQQQQQDATQQE